MDQTPNPRKLDLPFTYWDNTLKRYIYQRPVPPNAMWLLQKKKITNSLGTTPRDAYSKHPAIHLKWETAITRATESVKGEPEEVLFMDSALEFLSAEASKLGGVLPEIDWTLNGGEREKLWKAWLNWNTVHNTRPEASEDWFNQ